MSSPVLPGHDPAPSDQPEAVTLLVACHDKIRRFLTTADRLASAEAAPDEDVSSACRSIVRYFTEALPRHSDDEDLSLAPRLRAAGWSGAFLDEMTAEHGRIDDLLADLLPRWSAVAEEPGRRAGAELEKPTRALRELFDGHLAREEAELLPRLREVLGDAALAEIAAEMRARRDEGSPR
jgi:hemerythrin-like domain-containing protein